VPLFHLQAAPDSHSTRPGWFVARPPTSTGSENPFDPSWQTEERPRVWRLAVLEWAIFGVNVMWFLLVVVAG
jgi:hypothetical protein